MFLLFSETVPKGSKWEIGEAALSEAPPEGAEHPENRSVRQIVSKMKQYFFMS